MHKTQTFPLIIHYHIANSLLGFTLNVAHNCCSSSLVC